jgi:NADPH2:quinone reductase
MVAAGSSSMPPWDLRFASKLRDSGLTEDEASSIPVCAIASFIALYHTTGLGLPTPTTPKAEKFDFASQRLLIIGAGSNCGRYAVQLAKLSGFGQIISVVSLNNEKELRSLGATHVIKRG